jgi:hypothetical protein
MLQWLLFQRLGNHGDKSENGPIFTQILTGQLCEMDCPEDPNLWRAHINTNASEKTASKLG